ncbi:TRAP transporter small permease [Evansella clarkii]|uniref:TRAP transporter small permease n=1 Tax=Evansella clarkii TaxID=79879 RepID=UPI0011161F11|nr:TRAP transporter small permease [Evansella clarkii]
MQTISDSIAKIEKVTAAFLMLIMAVVVAASVIFRYFLNSPLSWAGEVSIFLLAWISFIGGSLGLKYKSQASVTILIDYVPANVRRIIQITGYLLMLLFLVFILYYCYKWVMSPSVGFQRSTALQIPMWIPYSAVPVGLTFASVHILNNLIGTIQEGKLK